MSYSCKSADDVLKTIKDDKIEIVDLRFADRARQSAISPRLA
jgi:hypothetical protein